MSIIARSFCRFTPVIRSGVTRSVAKLNGGINTTRPFTRSLWHLTGSTKHRNLPASTLCSCGCGIHGMHTRGDRELVEFLQEEIVAEKKNLQSGGYLPSHLDDFVIKANGAELTLTKSFHDEQISVSLNVNHTVDADAPVETNEQGDMGELKSRPSFEVDFKIGSKTMSFTCSYTGPSEAGADQNDDVFGINEVTIYEGEWGEETYCVSGDILDGMMYDLLMNMLEERGISNEFAEKLSTLCSDFEHSLYVNFLQEMQNLVKRK